MLLIIFFLSFVLSVCLSVFQFLCLSKANANRSMVMYWTMTFPNLCSWDKQHGLTSAMSLNITLLFQLGIPSINPA